MPTSSAMAWAWSTRPVRARPTSNSCSATMSGLHWAITLAVRATSSLPSMPTQRWTLYVMMRAIHQSHRPGCAACEGAADTGLSDRQGGSRPHWERAKGPRSSGCRLTGSAPRRTPRCQTDYQMLLPSLHQTPVLRSILPMGKRARKQLLDPEQIDAFRTKEWKSLREFVLSRDGGNCQACNLRVRGRDWTVAHRTPHD